MHRQFIFLFLISFLLLFSCKNDQLFDEREVFIGTWDWDYSLHVHACPPVSTDTLQSADNPSSYSIDISKREKIFFIKDGDVQRKSPIFVSFFAASNVLQNGYSFSIYFDEDNQELIDGHISQDSLPLSSYWPDEYVNDACNVYVHYFRRAE